jgi:hypothetical protein
MESTKNIIHGLMAYYSFYPKKVIELLNKYNAQIKPNATNEKVLSVLKSFLTNNNKFAKEYIKLCLDKGYLREEDFLTEGNLNTPNPLYLNTTGDSDDDGDGLAMGGVYGKMIDSGLNMIKGIFKSPEANQEALKGILALETAKVQAGGESNAKYWIAGAVVIGVFAITGLIIYKARK